MADRHRRGESIWASTKPGTLRAEEIPARAKSPLLTQSGHWRFDSIMATERDPFLAHRPLLHQAANRKLPGHAA